MTLQRRSLLFLLGASAAAWPLAARAQQNGRVRRVGMLTFSTEDDHVNQSFIALFREGLAKLGWIEGRNLRIDIRFGAANADLIRSLAAELVALHPDVIVTYGGAPTIAVQQQTQAIPIVFAAVGDPLVNGIVKSLARPDGNATGVSNLYASIAGKWLELLKEAAPQIKRAGLMYNPLLASNTEGSSFFFPFMEDAARLLNVQVISIPYRNIVEIVRAVDLFAAEPNGGLVVVPPSPTAVDRQAILQLATVHRVPAIYQDGIFAAEGGLMAYGGDVVETYRTASTYVDRILLGAKVSDLPVQLPTKFRLVVNLKTAKAIGLTIPETFLVRADEVIE
jgi:putative ABC transport system substrate-binding protein